MFFQFFFFKQKTAYELRISDWSSDVCSSDLHIGLVVRERRRCRARRTLRQREAELERCHAIVDVVDDSAAEHLAEPCQMIGRLIMIAVRCVPRARPGPARQHMPAMSMGNIEIERDVAPAEAAYRLLEPIGSRHHRLERSEEHTSELQSLMRISYAAFCLKK